MKKNFFNVIRAITIIVILCVGCMGSIGNTGYRALQKIGIVHDTEGMQPTSKTLDVEIPAKASNQDVENEEYSWLNEWNSKISAVTGKIDDTLDTQLAFKYSYINCFGAIQKAFGRNFVVDINETENIVKLKDGHLTSVIKKISKEAIDEKVIMYRQIADYCEEQDIPFLFVLAPYKVAPDDDRLPRGIEDYSNENADEFIAGLQHENVDVLDLRQCAKDDGLNWSEMFYITDHHWTTDTGFWAFQKIAQYCEQKYHLSVKQETLDINNYDKILYPRSFLGSRGRRVGEYYAGVDDFVYINPLFDVSQTVRLNTIETVERTGDFLSTIINPAHAFGKEKNLFKADLYGSYAYGNGCESETINHKTNNGMTMLFGRDSFGDVVFPYFSLSYEKVIESHAYLSREELDCKLDGEKVDVIIYMVNPSNI